MRVVGSLCCGSVLLLVHAPLVWPQGAAERLARGRTLYAETCANPYCHGTAGARAQAPALRDKAWSGGALRNIIINGVPRTSMPPFGDRLNDEQLRALVDYILSVSSSASGRHDPARNPESRTATPKNQGPVREYLGGLMGDPERGAELFYQQDSGGRSGCTHCHRIGGGRLVGPDLVAASRQSPRRLARDIMEPNVELAAGMELVSLRMRDGEALPAVVVDESDIHVRVYDLSVRPPVLIRLLKSEIQERVVEPRSAMPLDLGERYTVQQVLDLLSFLMSEGSGRDIRVRFDELD